MFDVGFAELFLLSLIGLLVLGPERLPAVARTLGGFMRKARHSWYNLKRTVEAELAAAEASQSINEAKREIKAVQAEVAQIGRDLDQVVEDTNLTGTPKQSATTTAATTPEADTGHPLPTGTGDEPDREAPDQATLNLDPEDDRGAREHRDGDELNS